jgi:hypothetical protein
MNLAGNQAGLLNQGFLQAEFGPMSLSVGDGPPNLAPQSGKEADFRRRWPQLQELDQSLRAPGGHPDRGFVDHHDYYRGAVAIIE